ncbi:MAG: LapA family protein [Gammaproteobacteria bacterium]|jgi:uncharacterized integral membrane protein
MEARLKPALLIVLVALGIVFALQNVADVEVQFLLWSVTLPRAILLLVVLAVGIVIGAILHSIHRRRQQAPTPPPPKRVP